MNKTEVRDLEDIEIHELANLTPTMTSQAYETLKDSLESNGQRVPIVLWRDKIIDGRHRTRALRELGKTTVLCEIEDSNSTEEDIKVLILEVLENRRHQTTTQKAIMGYNEYAKAKKDGVKLSLGAAASKVGSTRLQVSRARDLAKLTNETVMKMLFEGNKINIGTLNSPRNTDNLLTLINYFKTAVEEVIDQSDTNTVSEDLTDAEIERIDKTLQELEFNFSKRLLAKLSSKLYYNVLADKEIKNYSPISIEDKTNSIIEE